MENNLQKLAFDIREWSDKTFGEHQRNPAIIYHLKKEVDELIDEINKTQMLGSDDSIGIGEFGRQLHKLKLEYADCFMLLLDSAAHFDFTVKDILQSMQEKLEINKKRHWGKPDVNGVCEHIRKT